MLDSYFMPACGNRFDYFVSALHEMSSVYFSGFCYAKFRIPFGEAVVVFGNCLCFACKFGSRFDFGFDFSSSFCSNFHCSLCFVF